MTPAISVIIPTLREEKLLEQTLSQFTPELKHRFNVEIVVSDGGSTDRTLEIAHRLADVVVEKVPGVPQNISIGRNLGARAAKGEIFIFINADTRILDIESFLQEMILAVGRPGVSGATCSVGVYREEERLADRLFHNFYNWWFNLLNRIGMGMGRGECQVLKRATFFAVNGYNERLGAGEDYDLFVRVRRLGRITFLPHLKVSESPRRYRRYGYLQITLLWLLNSISVFLFHRSMNKEWEPVR